MGQKKNNGEMLNTEELASRWEMHPGTLERWRSENTGPAYVKFGKGKRAIVLYRLVDILAYEKKITVTPKSKER